MLVGTMLVGRLGVAHRRPRKKGDPEKRSLIIMRNLPGWPRIGCLKTAQLTLTQLNSEPPPDGATRHIAPPELEINRTDKQQRRKQWTQRVKTVFSERDESVAKTRRIRAEGFAYARNVVYTFALFWVLVRRRKFLSLPLSLSLSLYIYIHTTIHKYIHMCVYIYIHIVIIIQLCITKQSIYT